MQSILIARPKLRSLSYTASLSLLFMFGVSMRIASSQAIPQTDQPLLSQPLTNTWRYQSERMSNLAPSADAHSVYVPQTGGALVALDLEHGQLRWRAEVGGELSTNGAIDDRFIYVATQYQEVQGEHPPVHGTLRALSKETGVTLWMRTLPSPLRGGLVASATSIFGGDADGRFYSFDKRSGLTLWINQYTESVSNQPAIFGALVYFGSDAGSLFALNQADGKLAWRYRSHGAIQGSVAIINGAVSFGGADGYVYSYGEAQKRLLWRKRTGASVQAVVAIDKGVLAVSLDNYAYLLTHNKGAIIWRRLLPGRISARPLTAADGVLFTPISTDNAIVLSLKDGKPVNTLPLGEENSSIAAPILAGKRVLISAPHALIAFAAPH